MHLEPHPHSPQPETSKPKVRILRLLFVLLLSLTTVVSGPVASFASDSNVEIALNRVESDNGVTYWVTAKDAATTNSSDLTLPTWCFFIDGKPVSAGRRIDYDPSSEGDHGVPRNNDGPMFTDSSGCLHYWSIRLVQFGF